MFGCLLVFLIQWMFLGDLRSAIIVGVNIPFALFFSIIILVLRGEDANLLSVGAVDFGIIVDSAVILVENVFRNFQAQPEERQRWCWRTWRKALGGDPTRRRASDARHGWTDRLRLILISAHAGRQGDLLLHRDHRRRLHAAVHHAGRRGPDLRPDGAHLWLCAGRRADRHLHRHAGADVLPAARGCQRSRDDRGAAVAAPSIRRCCAGR